MILCWFLAFFSFHGFHLVIFRKLSAFILSGFTFSIVFIFHSVLIIYEAAILLSLSFKEFFKIIASFYDTFHVIYWFIPSGYIFYSSVKSNLFFNFYVILNFDSCLFVTSICLLGNSFQFYSGILAVSFYHIHIFSSSIFI